MGKERGRKEGINEGCKAGKGKELNKGRKKKNIQGL